MKTEAHTLDYTYRDIAKMIDHSLLNPTLTDSQLESGCRLAAEYDVASVCVLPHGDTITIGFEPRCAQLAQLPGASFYHRLRDKFGRLAY